MKRVLWFFIFIIILFTLLIFDRPGYSAFSGPTEIQSTFGVKYCSPDGLCVGDVNNNGSLDLIASGYRETYQWYLRRYINDGSGSFPSVANLSPGVADSSVALGDINNDGYIDLVIAGKDSGYHFRRLLNDGNGNFPSSSSIGTSVRDASLALGDLDKDGDLDIVITGLSGSRIFRAYYNRGDGVFPNYVNLTTGIHLGSIALGDINNDGDLDIVFTGTSDGGGTRFFGILDNQGDGTFGAPRNVDASVGLYHSSVALGDINNDSYLDIVVAGHDNTTAYLIRYLNNGSGSFTGKVSFGTGLKRTSLALGDINSDGDLDLAIAGETMAPTRYFHVYDNNGSGTFTLNQTLTPGLGRDGASIVFADINNDNELDLISAGNDGTTDHLDSRINTSPANAPPSIPGGLTVINDGGYYRFRWNHASDGQTPNNLMRYKIAIGTNSSTEYNFISSNIRYPRGQATVGNNVIIGGQPCLLTRIPNTKTVFWKVWAIDTSFKRSVTSTSLQIDTIANANPESPVSGFSPAGGTLLSSLPANFSWNPGNDPSYYDPPATLHYVIRIDDDGEIVANYDFELTTSDGVTSYNNVNLLNNREYYWAVKTVDDEGAESGWSTLQNFMVVTNNNPPNPPIAGFSPSGGISISSVITNFTWNHGSDPEVNDTTNTLHYILRIDDDGEIVIDWEIEITTSDGDNFVNSVLLSNNKQYTWAVRTVDDEGEESGWSVLQTFYVITNNSPPDPPVAGFDPANDAVMSTSNINFSWNAGSDINPTDTSGTLHYIIRIDDDGEINTTFDFELVTSDGNNFTNNIVLLDNTYYYWGVKTVDDEGAESGWSSLQSFYILTTKLNVPIWREINTDQLDAYLSWEISNEPQLAGYNLYWGTVPGVYDNSEHLDIVGGYIIKNLDCNTTYYLTLRAYDIANVESESAQERQIRIDDFVGDQHCILYNSILKPYEGDEMALLLKLDRPAEVEISIYSKADRLINKWTESYPAGSYNKTWDLKKNGEYIGSGTYIVIVKTDTWKKRLLLGVVK